MDHRILESILRERIHDERFICFINKLFKAGYFDMEHQFHPTKQGNAQGSCASPIWEGARAFRLCLFHLLNSLLLSNDYPNCYY